MTQAGKNPARGRQRIAHAFGVLAVGALLAGHAAPALAGPLAAAGDTALRHDLQLLSDHGLLSAPLTAWPLSWSDISASLETPDAESPLPPHIRSALLRVEARLEKALDGRLQTRLEVGGIIHNDVPTWRADPLPYGGVKGSGVGREGPEWAFREMTEERLLVLKR
jgi:hypothetical protein